MPCRCVCSAKSVYFRVKSPTISPAHWVDSVGQARCSKSPFYRVYPGPGSGVEEEAAISKKCLLCFGVRARGLKSFRKKAANEPSPLFMVPRIMPQEIMKKQILR